MMTRALPCWIQEPIILSESPVWVTGTQALGLFSIVFLVTVAGQWFRSRTARTQVDVRCWYCMQWLNSVCHNACSNLYLLNISQLGFNLNMNFVRGMKWWHFSTFSSYHVSFVRTREQPRTPFGLWLPEWIYHHYVQISLKLWNVDSSSAYFLALPWESHEHTHLQCWAVSPVTSLSGDIPLAVTNQTELKGHWESMDCRISRHPRV